MRACGMRSLSMLAATVLLSVYQLSPVRAEVISVVPTSLGDFIQTGFNTYSVDFGDVTVDTLSMIDVMATFEVDPGFMFNFLQSTNAGFPLGSAGGCVSNTCNIELFFQPTTSGDFSSEVFLFGQEMALPPENGIITSEATISLSGTGVAAVPNTTSLPAALPLFATGLGALGLLGWYKKRKARVSLFGAT